MYSGKTVLITGTSRGVGKLLVDHFLKNGAKVIAVSRTGGEDNTNLRNFKIDLSHPSGIASLFSNIDDLIKEESIDIVINNAAAMTSQYAVKMQLEDMDAMVKTNLVAPFLICREASKRMFGPYGRIVNTGSIADVYEAMGDSIYAACKAGLKTMTNVLAKEFARQEITCNTLAISAFDTDMLAKHKPERVEVLVKSFPIPRKAVIDDITNVIDFFCSEKSSYITAQTIYLGGLHK